MTALREGTRVSGRTRFVRAGLVGSELALALMLLAGAGLLGPQLRRAARGAAGVRHRPAAHLPASVPPATYRTTPSAPAFFERAAAEIERAARRRGASR